ncbi:DUF4012 domain-containing protein [Xylanimonas sp. McL0601]|uniref:DUF4012 domain-containing protein n=1 Tax=Xylanimonas sp. McL0601 TaxID=3414739 RepID=UPI003CE94F1B
MPTQPVLVPGPAGAERNPEAALEPAAPARNRRRPRARRIVLAVVLGLLLVPAGGSLLLARDARAAQAALDSAGERVPALQQAVSGDADPAAIGPQLAALQRDTAAARSHTDGPLWAVGARLPVVSHDLDAVARIAAALDDVARDVAPALVDVRAAVAGTQRTADGGVDLTALRALAPRVDAAQTTMTAVTASLARLDPAHLMPQLADPLVRLRSRLDAVAATVTTADRAVTLLPPMLGDDGPRSYLVLALTNAELRSGGGIPGAVVLLRADAGRVEVVREIAGVDLGEFSPPVTTLDPETTAIFSDRTARFIQDVTFTPEFPTSAALAARMWAQAQGEVVDGVIATDPVALAGLLRATGPVDVPLPAASAEHLGAATVTVTADSAVQLLEHDVYTSLGLAPAEADAFFGALVSATAARLESDDVDFSALVGALAAGAAQHRLVVWSAHEEEQAALTGTVLAGTFLSSPRAADAVGVFLDDAISGKMSWFLDTSVTLVSSRCTATGRVDTIDVTLTSTAPADAATSLPTYVAGWPDGIHAPGTIRTVLRVAGPVGAPTPRLERDGAVLGLDTHPLGGRSVASGTVTLAPGQSTTVRVEAAATPAASQGDGPQPGGTLDIWSTPTARAGGLQTVPVAVCAPAP